jgi:hypothetical protein
MARKEKKVKKKKSLIRRMIKWTGYTLLFFIVLILLIPVIFKDEIKTLVLKEVNATLKADVKIKDFDLTFLSTFPNLTIQLSDVSVTGRTAFKGVELANIKNIEAHVGLWDVIGGDQISIDEVHISDAHFDVRVDPEGNANYDIVIPTPPTTSKEEPSSFKLALNAYSLNNVSVEYDDQQGDMYAKLKNLNHTGSGDLTADIFDFQTTTSIDALTFEMEGLRYLSEVKTTADAILSMEFNDQSSKFSLKENTLSLNQFQTSIDGYYEMFNGYDQMDLKLNTKQIAFKQLLSLIPTFYQSGYESMVAKGNVKMNGELKGRLDDKNMPGWDFGLNVNKASIKYAGVPGSINNIALKAASKFQGGADLDKMTVDVDKFHADFLGNLIDASLKMRYPMTDPLIDTKVLANVNLATLGKVMPLAKGESYTGKLNADVVLDGRLSAIESEKYEQFKAAGTIQLYDMLYKTMDLNESVAISKMLIRFSPQNLAVEQLNAKTGKSDFAIVGKIDNYLGYVFRNELLKGEFNFNSQQLDIDQLMGIVPTAPEANPTIVPEPVPESVEPLLIPENVDFNLNTSIQKVIYNGIDMNNVKGAVIMKEEVATLNNVTMNTMGGTVGLRGNYSSKDHNKPAIDLGYHLTNIDIQSLAKNFLTIQKLAPIAKYAQGKLTSDLNLKSTLTKSLEPIYTSLTGDGDIFTNMVTVSGFEPMKKLGESMQISKLSSQTLKDVKAFFKFKDGKVFLTPFTVKMQGIDTRISGSSSIDQKIDYKLEMNVPKELIPGSLIQSAEAMMSKVKGVVPKISIGTIPEFIKVNTLIGGTVKKPVIKTDFKEALLKATGNFKESMKQQGKELLNQAKDSVKTIINNKVDEVKADLIAKKNQIMADAQVQADKVKAEAKKAADVIRKEADTECGNLNKEAGNNPVKKKTADITCNQLKKTAENKATKLEQEADSKADNIMVKAKEKADALH